MLKQKHKNKPKTLDMLSLRVMHQTRGDADASKRLPDNAHNNGSRQVPMHTPNYLLTSINCVEGE